MVDEKILNILCCPKCKNSLKEIKEGLYCKNCNKTYKIKDGIIIFLDETTI